MMETNQLKSINPFSDWDLDLLIDYVLKYHHRNIRRRGEDLIARITRLAAEHHELDRVADHFRNSVADLDIHCQKEENVLYPFILELFHASELGQQVGAFHCGSIQFPINAMMGDHGDELERYERIEELTHGFTAPAGAGEEYIQAMTDLKKYKQDLEEHIVMEDEIIFPRALQLEAANLQYNQ